MRTLLVACLALAACTGSSATTDTGRSTVTVDRVSATADGLDAIELTVVVLDSRGHAEPGRTVHASFVDQSGAISSSGFDGYTDSTGTWREPITFTSAGTYGIQITVDYDTVLGTTPTVAFVAGPTASLELVNGNSTSGSVGQTLPPVQLQLVDAHGNPTTDVQVVHASVPAGIEGTLTATSVAGIAEFADLELTAAGSLVVSFTLDGNSTAVAQLSVESDGPPPAPSLPTLAFTHQPTSAKAGHTLGDVSVSAYDVSGNPVYYVQISFTLTGGPGQLEGFAPSYGDLTNAYVTAPGTYQLVASADGYVSATSAPFTITVGDAYALRFDTQPSAVPVQTRYVPDALTSITPAPVVTLTDEFGNVIDDSTTAVTMSAYTGTLAGTTTLTLAHGSATFPDLELPYAGMNALVAQGGTASGMSASFTILPSFVVNGPGGPLVPSSLTVPPDSSVFFYLYADGSVVADDLTFCTPADTDCANATVSPAGTTYVHEFGAVSDYTFHVSPSGSGDVQVQ